MEDFISKEFECRNRIDSDNKVINSIVDFLRTIDDKIEIENKNGKRVNAKSFVKMMGLDIEYGYKFTLYVYGNDRENNLKRIEELLEKKEFYSLEKIEKLEKEEESEENKLLEEEILHFTAEDKKEIIKNDIENKVKLLKEKRDSIHLEPLNLDNNIIYIKNNDKTAIIDVINNNIYNSIKKLSSHYEIPINETDLKNFLSKLVNIIEEKEMKYFYIYLFSSNVKKYFYNQFDTIFIKKLAEAECLPNTDYNIEINNNFVEESIKSLDYVLEDKRKSADYSIDIYMIANTSNLTMDIFRIINIVQNIGKIYEIKSSITDNIIEKIRLSYEDRKKNNIDNPFHNEEYLDNIKEFKDYFQKEFEELYVSNVLENNDKKLNIDYKYVNRLIRRL